MVKAFWNNEALRTLLDCIIADLVGRVQRFFEITGVKHLFPGVGVIAPQAGKTISL